MLSDQSLPSLRVNMLTRLKVIKTDISGYQKANIEKYKLKNATSVVLTGKIILT